MAKKLKNKVKKVATQLVCQSKVEVVEGIRKIGEHQRELARLEAEINDILAKAADERKEKIDMLQWEIERLSISVQIWCEANRDSLLSKGLKTANLITGEISWRVRPPSVTLRKIDVVIERLERFGLHRFIRTKKEVNKDAILADPMAVKEIEGIHINSGIEDFVITPFEVDIQN